MKKNLAIVLVIIIGLTSVAYADDTLLIMPISAPIENTINLVYPKSVDLNEIKINGNDITLKNKILYLNGVMYLPLREISNAIEVDITWNNETSRIELIKGPNYTSLAIGINSYFKFRMAPVELSNQPLLINSVTYVPVEFFNFQYDKNITVEDGKLTLDDEMYAIHEGYVQSIEILDNYTRISISSLESTDDIYQMTYLNISENTIFNKEVSVGNYLKSISPPIMTMSIPGQTGSNVIY
jgi:hypothetical protein